MIRSHLVCLVYKECIKSQPSVKSPESQIKWRHRGDNTTVAIGDAPIDTAASIISHGGVTLTLALTGRTLLPLCLHPSS